MHTVDPELEKLKLEKAALQRDLEIIRTKKALCREIADLKRQLENPHESWCGCIKCEPNLDRHR